MYAQRVTSAQLAARTAAHVTPKPHSQWLLDSFCIHQCTASNITMWLWFRAHLRREELLHGMQTTMDSYFRWVNIWLFFGCLWYGRGLSRGFRLSATMIDMYNEVFLHNFVYVVQPTQKILNRTRPRLGGSSWRGHARLCIMQCALCNVHYGAICHRPSGSGTIPWNAMHYEKV